MRRTLPFKGPRIGPIAYAAFAILALAACDRSAPSSEPAGAVSEGEAEALEEAASMLDEQRIPEGALPDLGSPPSADAPGGTPATRQEPNP